MPEHTATLIARAVARDAPAAARQAAFGVLVQRFQHVVYRDACAALGDPHLAWDAAQDTFLTAYCSLEDLRTPAAFAAWLRRIVQTRCRSLRRAQRRADMPLDAVDAAMDQLDPAELVETLERRATIADAIRMLPVNQRIAVVLFYFVGYPQQEIADVLHVPLTTVKKRLQAARRRLQEKLVVDEPVHSRSEELTRQLRLLAAFAACDCDCALLDLVRLDGLEVVARDA